MKLFNVAGVMYFLLLSGLLSHLQIKHPAPRRSKFCQAACPEGEPDYDMNQPIGTPQGLNKPFPCKGYPKGSVQAHYKAGKKVKVLLTKHLLMAPIH